MIIIRIWSVPRTSLLILLLAYTAASLLHFAHNAEQAQSEDGWNPTTRVQVTTLELKDGLTRRVIDYW